ncbi:putative ABC transport system permease protein [Catenulispora sp. MAP5-51]|uniref:ABC transporter permease n=1 Tax=Catenulispora sp. MAP5-51 TaxID=3156298 RepID=UPI003514C1A0
MSAVWTAASAAIKRRRLQTFVLAVVVLLSTGMAVVTLGLLAAVSGPFDKVYAAAHGAHIVAEYSDSKASAAQIAQTAHAAGVVGSAGPYPVAYLHQPTETGTPSIGLAGTFTVVGRDRPDTAVDTLKLAEGRWPAGPGEIVLNLPQGDDRTTVRLIDVEHHVVTADGVDLKVVGYARSVSDSADGWVTPAEAQALGASETQMMYRFRQAGSDASLRADMAAVAATMPSGSLIGTSSYLAIKAHLATGPNTYVPFLTAFSILGLVVSVVIVGTVVSGAVVAGYRHIGILKALGFTPGQVTAVYILMVMVPAAIGCVLGTVVGSAAGSSMVSQAFYGISGNDVLRGSETLPAWVYPAVLLGMPALVAVSALLPAMKARRLPAAVVISAGAVPQTGRGLRVQRALGGSRLPPPVSLGLGWPFSRPGRTALTLSTVVLGVTTVTLAIGLSATVVKYDRTQSGQDKIQVTATVDDPAAPWHPAAPAHTDDELFSLLRALPGTAHVSADAPFRTHLAGSTDAVAMDVETGDTAALHPDLARGRWIEGPGEVVVGSEFWHQHHLALGQTIVLGSADGQVPEKVVGEESGGWDVTSTDWNRFVGLRSTHRAMTFYIGLTKGTEPNDYAAKAAGLDPALKPALNDGIDTTEKVMISVISTLTGMLIAVSALGVFNAVVMTTRERRKDVGVLKSIGMTPRQVIALVVTAMAALGLLGGLIGLPAGMVVHRIVVPATGHGTGRDLPASLLHVWAWPTVAALAVSGAAIAALGAFLPSVRASRSSAAEVLRTE